MDAWRLRTFQAVQAAYAAELQVYQGNEPAAGLSTGPAPAPRLGYRAVERRELKQGALDLLFRQIDNRVGRGGGDGPPAGRRVDVGRPRYLQFFERAFEWGR